MPSKYSCASDPPGPLLPDPRVTASEVVSPPEALAPGVWMRGLQTLGPEKTAVLMNLVPLFTAVLAIVLLGETLHLYHAVGGGLILLGIGLAQWKPARVVTEVVT